MATYSEVQGALQKCMETMDVGFAHKYWSEMFPGQPPPKNYAETRICLHMARTASDYCRLPDRLYSHHWLTERQFPSKLPEKYRPSWDGRIIVSAVGLIVKSVKDDVISQRRAIAIRTAMEKGVLEMYDQGIEDPVLVSQHMWRRAREVKEW